MRAAGAGGRSRRALPARGRRRRLPGRPSTAAEIRDALGVASFHFAEKYRQFSHMLPQNAADMTVLHVVSPFCAPHGHAPFIAAAVFRQECVGQLAPFGPT